MTKRHRLYLKRYGTRIGRERRLRRIKAAEHLRFKGVSRVNFQKVLADFMKTNPKKDQRIRAGKQTIGNKIKNLFRKPTI